MAGQGWKLNDLKDRGGPRPRGRERRGRQGCRAPPCTTTTAQEPCSERGAEEHEPCGGRLARAWLAAPTAGLHYGPDDVIGLHARRRVACSVDGDEAQHGVSRQRDGGGVEVGRRAGGRAVGGVEDPGGGITGRQRDHRQFREFAAARVGRHVGFHGVEHEGGSDGIRDIAALVTVTDKGLLLAVTGRQHEGLPRHQRRQRGEGLPVGAYLEGEGPAAVIGGGQQQIHLALPGCRRFLEGEGSPGRRHVEPHHVLANHVPRRVVRITDGKSAGIARLHDPACLVVPVLDVAGVGGNHGQPSAGDSKDRERTRLHGGEHRGNLASACEMG